MSETDHRCRVCGEYHRDAACVPIEPKMCVTCRHWRRHHTSFVLGTCEFPMPKKLRNFLSQTTLDTDGSKCQTWEAREETT